MNTTSLSAVRVTVLGSGSAGNATVVSDGVTTVLVDCGFSARETGRRLAASNFDPASVSAVLVTHEHSDHVRGIDVFARRFSADVYATPGTRRGAGLDTLACNVVTVTHGSTLSIGTLTVTPFETSHDAAEPCGYVIETASGVRFGLVTDTGVLTPVAEEALAGCDVLAIESNHDVSMLESGPYPRFLKNRIRSHRGHLANDQAADALERLAGDRLTHVIAMHRSQQNNSVELVEQALASRLARLGIDASVTCAEQASTRDVGGSGLLGGEHG